MEALLISACLVGENCKYNGGSNTLPSRLLTALRKRYRLIPVCPEVLGGLPVPREPSERRDGGVYTQSGRDVSEAYIRGAEIALDRALREGCRAALLKERSPSCGKDQIYDGSFSHRVIPGNGVTAERLIDAGIIVCGESEAELLLHR